MRNSVPKRFHSHRTPGRKRRIDVTSNIHDSRSHAGFVKFPNKDGPFLHFFGLVYRFTPLYTQKMKRHPPSPALPTIVSPFADKSKHRCWSHLTLSAILHSKKTVMACPE